MKIRNWDSNLKVRLFAEAMLNITFWMFYPFLTIYFAEEFGKDRAGLLLIFSQVFSVIANLMGGFCADRFGRKTMMVFGAFGQGMCFLVFAFANSPWFHSPWLGFICFALAGVFGSLYWPASQAMVADVVEEKDQTHVFAIFYTSINIAVVVGPIVGAIFYVHYRFELLLAAGLIGMLLSAILAKWTRETVPKQTSAIVENTKWYSNVLKQIKDYGIIFKDKTFLLFIIAGVLGAQTFMQLDLLLPIYINDFVEKQTFLKWGEWSLTVGAEQAFGIILSENGLLVALLTVTVTKVMSKYKDKNIFILSSLTYAAGIIIFGNTTLVWGFILAMAIFTLGELIAAGIQQSFVSKIAPKHMRGQYFAAASLRFTIGRTIAPISIPLTVWIGYDWTFIFLAFMSVLSAFLYWLMFEMAKRTTFLLQRKILHNRQ